jgi:hypothetical protein
MQVFTETTEWIFELIEEMSAVMVYLLTDTV